MRLVAISDTHNRHGQLDGLGLRGDQRLPPGDILVHSGDACGYGTLEELEVFVAWLDLLPYAHKIYVPGNHDKALDEPRESVRKQAERLVRSARNVIYLKDASIAIGGLLFSGSPWQSSAPTWGFYLPRGSKELKDKRRGIHPKTNVLITHEPPYGILDMTLNRDNIGCPILRRIVGVVKPKAHFFGHVHESAGVFQTPHTIFCNAASMNRSYEIAHPPMVVDL